MTAHLIGYTRVSASGQDLSGQRAGLEALGVPADRIYVAHGLMGSRGVIGTGRVCVRRGPRAVLVTHWP